MVLEADFIGDVASHCAEKLRKAGYIVRESNANSVIFTYISLTHRRVSARPRKVHKAPYTVSGDLIEAERKFLIRVEAGEDLWPYQSRKSKDAAVRDKVLTDFGIRQFYLETEPDLSHQGISRLDEHILFAVVREDDFYTVGIYGDDWTTRHVIDAARDHFPHIIESITAPIIPDEGGTSSALGAKGEEYEYLSQRRAQTSGVSDIRPAYASIADIDMSYSDIIEVEIKTNKLIELIQKLQQAVSDVVTSRMKSEKTHANARLKIVWHGEKPVAVTEPAGFTVSLEDLLSVSSL